MTDRGVFVLFDLGETLVDLTDLVGRIADARREIPGMEQDAERTSHDWIRRTSVSLREAEELPFVREIDVAAMFCESCSPREEFPITASGADELLRRAWNDFEPACGLSRRESGVARRASGLAEGLGVVTDGDIVNVNRLVKRLDLERYFRVIVTSERYAPTSRIRESIGRRSKPLEPSPQQYLRLRHAARPSGSRGGRHGDSVLPRGLLSESGEAATGSAATFGPQNLRDVIVSWSKKPRPP